MAWYYFVGGPTQQDIASRMGMTRLRVNKLIGQVREDGAVHIGVAPPLTDCVELGEALADRYRLVDAAVVPDLPDHLEQKRVIGEAAGAMIGKLIEGRDLGIGIATGRTLSFAVSGRIPTAGSWA